MDWKQLLKLFGPATSAISVNEKIISAAAGFVAIALIMLVSQFFLDQQALPWVVASMGASAVLLFAVPKGPLSQPWSFVAGHLISAFVGISVAKLISDPIVASALAVSLAIFFMYLSGCLHPPGGATALTAIVGGTSITDLGYDYMLTPLLINLIVMLVWALIINNLLSNRCYPNGFDELAKLNHNHNKQISTAGENSQQTGVANSIHRSELHAALTEMDILCKDIMTTPVITVNYDTEIELVWQLMIDKRVHAFPVVDRVDHVLGIISLTDFLNQINFKLDSGIISQLGDFIRKTKGEYTQKPEYAGHLMTKNVISIGEEQHILDLVEIFYSHNIHHLPVLNSNNKLQGIITPKDLLKTFQNLG